ncbi:dihydrofolate reductase family protein [Herbidospora galbida]|nr:dihydrofolate reductase family protein [Herbidospora galbida]
MIHANITTSLDGFVAGPNWAPGRGLGDGGERLHYWVFGGPWTYEKPSFEGERHPVDVEVLGEFHGAGAGIVGRGMFDAAGRWGGENPFHSPVFVLTNRITDDLPTAFTYVSDAGEALERARETAGDRDIAIGGGADVIRQYLRMGVVDRLSVHIAPVVLGGGTALFDGTFQADLDLVDCRHSPLATHLTYDIRG